MLWSQQQNFELESESQFEVEREIVHMSCLVLSCLLWYFLVSWLTIPWPTRPRSQPLPDYQKRPWGAGLKCRTPAWLCDTTLRLSRLSPSLTAS